MSTTVVYYCDRCSSRIVEGRTELLIECGPLMDIRDTDSIDLCPSCADALAGFLKAPAMIHPPVPRVRSAS